MFRDDIFPIGRWDTQGLANRADTIMNVAGNRRASENYYYGCARLAQHNYHNYQSYQLKIEAEARKNSKIANETIRFLSDKLRQANEQIVDLAAKSAEIAQLREQVAQLKALVEKSTITTSSNLDDIAKETIANAIRTSEEKGTQYQIGKR